MHAQTPLSRVLSSSCPSADRSTHPIAYRPRLYMLSASFCLLHMDAITNLKRGLKVFKHSKTTSNVLVFNLSPTSRSGADPGGGGGGGGGGVVTPPALDHQFYFSTNFLTSKKKKSKKIARNILWTLCTLI